MKRIVVPALVICGILFFLAGNTHRWLPMDTDWHLSLGFDSEQAALLLDKQVEH